jgi:stage III sporulation protein AA
MQMNMMKDELLAVIPPRYRSRLPSELFHDLLEIRMRLGQGICLVGIQGMVKLEPNVSAEDLRFCINAASRYSPWNATSIRHGYLTAAGGHRIGICGECAGDVLQNPTSICIRVAKDMTGIADHLLFRDSTLIIGPPGYGKTTLLRESIRRISRKERGAVAVVDERCEIFPITNGRICFDTGPCTDVLSGRDKSSGIESVLRSMGPAWLAVDEITAKSDCEALLHAGWCGVKLLATAHASGLEDLRQREIYRPLAESGLFSSVVIMHPDKTCHQERI